MDRKVLTLVKWRLYSILHIILHLNLKLFETQGLLSISSLYDGALHYLFQSKHNSQKLQNHACLEIYLAWVKVPMLKEYIPVLMLSVK